MSFSQSYTEKDINSFYSVKNTLCNSVVKIILLH